MTSDRLYPARPFLCASVAVFRADRVLLAARAQPPLERLYSLPGGLVEPGESMAEAALRELQEEVGVAADMIGFVDHVEVVERDAQGRVSHHFVIAAHAAHWRAGEPRVGSEALDVRWVREEEVATLATTPGLTAVLRKAFAVARAARR